jgi:hypothetical protein
MNELCFNIVSPAAGLMEANGWVQHAARRCWNLGFNHYLVSKMACSLPPRLYLAWLKLFNAVHHISTASTSQLEAISNLMKQDSIDPMELNVQRPVLAQDEQDAEWEADQSVGIIQVDYEPATQCRLSIRANSRAASIWGINRASLLQSLAHHALPLPLAELDLHRTLAAALTDDGPAEAERYLRFVLECRDGVRAALVCCAVHTTYDQLGRVTQVLPLVLPPQIGGQIF